MKFKQCHVQNFGSYKDLSINFDSLGLINISGETGSGKSTILDMIPWILFGETSKDTKADDIRSWGSEDPTTGTLELENWEGDTLTVTRIRGSVSENDLYITYQDDNKIRGKSIVETQKLVETHVGTTADLYFTSAYLHQFSKADTFFLSRPTERREVFEKIVDQSFAIQLSDKVSESIKITKQEIDTLEKQDSFNLGKLELLQKNLEKSKTSKISWETEQTRKCNFLNVKSTQFDDEKSETLLNMQLKMHELLSNVKEYDAKISISTVRTNSTVWNVTRQHQLQEQYKLTSLTDVICPTCLGPCDNDNRKTRVRQLKLVINELDLNLRKAEIRESSLLNDISLLEQADILAKKMKDLESRENTYKDQLAAIVTDINPFDNQILDQENDLEKLNIVIKASSTNISDKKRSLTLLRLLYSLSFDLRGAILAQAIEEIERRTNEVLDTYFDAEILVRFSLESSDKLELEIQKSGNVCSFKQLSGGQRCMLKLAFNLSLMQLAENKAGIKFSTLMLDEPLTGLSDDLKIKAFSLFESLTKHYDTIVVIEHSDALKSCFNNTIQVTMEGDESKISHIR